MYDAMTRRSFVRRALAAGTAVPLISAAAVAAETSAAEPAANGEKLNLGVIGVAGRGASNLKGVAGENIVALCDIDSQRLGKASAQFPQAATYEDFRRLLDHPGLDGVVVSTPDHMHAIPVSIALRRKLPVYCEKPLTHSVYEARYICDLARQQNVPTQMGNQIHSGTNYRRVVEMIQAGVIGPVRRVHVWQGGGPRPGQRCIDGVPPKHVNYNLWLGPAPYRPFHESHFHFLWRYWWDFGGGQLADFCCHYIDLPVWALDLGLPLSIAAKGEKAHEGENETPGLMQVDYRFAARGDQPAVQLTWYHGGWMPPGAEAYEKKSAVLFEGDQGRLLADYGTRKVFLESGKEAEPVSPTIPDSIGHHAEWIAAVKTGSPTMSPFTYGAKLTEIGLLGNVAYRVGQPIEWDAENLRAKNCPEADQFIRRDYRRGWELA